MIKKIMALSILFSLFIQPVFAGDLILEAGTKVRLKLIDKISSKFNNEGDTVNFLVIDDIKLGDIVLIKEGTRATGTISELAQRGRIGKAGKLTISLDNTQAINDRKIPLSGTIIKRGEDKTILSIALGLAAFPPVSLLFLLMRGSDAQLPVGYQFQARVDRDITLSIDNDFIPVNKKN